MLFVLYKDKNWTQNRSQRTRVWANLCWLPYRLLFLPLDVELLSRERLFLCGWEIREYVCLSLCLSHPGTVFLFSLNSNSSNGVYQKRHQDKSSFTSASYVVLILKEDRRRRSSPSSSGREEVTVKVRKDAEWEEDEERKEKKSPLLEKLVRWMCVKLLAPNAWEETQSKDQSKGNQEKKMKLSLETLIILVAWEKKDTPRKRLTRGWMFIWRQESEVRGSKRSSPSSSSSSASSRTSSSSAGFLFWSKREREFLPLFKKNRDQEKGKEVRNEIKKQQG